MRGSTATTSRSNRAASSASSGARQDPQQGAAWRLMRHLPDSAMPDWVDPILALLSSGVPADDKNYAFEFKWDGVRALAFVDQGDVRLVTRNRIDTTRRYPEVAIPLGRALQRHTAILD